MAGGRSRVECSWTKWSRDLGDLVIILWKKFYMVQFSHISTKIGLAWHVRILSLQAVGYKLYIVTRPFSSLKIILGLGKMQRVI